MIKDLEIGKLSWITVIVNTDPNKRKAEESVVGHANTEKVVKNVI